MVHCITESVTFIKRTALGYAVTLQKYTYPEHVTNTCVRNLLFWAHVTSFQGSTSGHTHYTAVDMVIYTTAGLVCSQSTVSIVLTLLTHHSPSYCSFFFFRFLTTSSYSFTSLARFFALSFNCSIAVYCPSYTTSNTYQ